LRHGTQWTAAYVWTIEPRCEFHLLLAGAASSPSGETREGFGGARHGALRRRVAPSQRTSGRPTRHADLRNGRPLAAPCANANRSLATLHTGRASSPRWRRARRVPCLRRPLFVVSVAVQPSAAALRARRIPCPLAAPCAHAGRPLATPPHAVAVHTRSQRLPLPQTCREEPRTTTEELVRYVTTVSSSKSRRSVTRPSGAAAAVTTPARGPVSLFRLVTATP
jgi:hypothetical protein